MQFAIFEIAILQILIFTFCCNRPARPLGDPALRPALRPAFKVRRGRRSICAAMRRHAPPIPTLCPCDLSSADRRTSAGAVVHSSYLCSRLSPQRTFLRRLVRPATRGSISSCKEDASMRRCTGERSRSQVPGISVRGSAGLLRQHNAD